MIPLDRAYILAVSASLATFLTKPCNTFPGPHSTNNVAPSANIFCTVCVQRTGAVNCAIKFLLIYTLYCRKKSSISLRLLEGFLFVSKTTLQKEIPYFLSLLNEITISEMAVMAPTLEQRNEMRRLLPSCLRLAGLAAYNDSFKISNIDCIDEDTQHRNYENNKGFGTVIVMVVLKKHKMGRLLIQYPGRLQKHFLV